MTVSTLYGNNQLIRKTVARMFPACFAAVMAASITLMMDSLLAGSLIGSLAIAAVAVGDPIVSVGRSLTQTISSGALVKMTVNVGRNDREAINRAYSLGFWGTVALGAILVAAANLFAGVLVLLFGAAGNAELAAQAGIYLHACSVHILFSCMNIFLGKVLSLFGYQSLVFLIALMNIGVNLTTSIIFVRMLPEGYAIAGLGIGSCIAAASCSALAFLVIKLKKLPVKLKLYAFGPGELMEALKLGFPTAGNNIADGMVSGVVNNIIVRGFSGNPMALAVYTAVKSVFNFTQAATIGAAMATGPLFGILYGARDKSALRRTLREGYKIGLVFAVVWCGVLMGLLPVLQKIYGMSGNTDVRTGVMVCFLFIPFFLAIRVMAQVFESTEKAGMGILYSILPDTVLYPLMLMVLMPRLGYMGIWLSFGGNGLLFLVLLFVVRSIKERSFRPSVDRMLCLDESIRSNVPMLDISIRANSFDVANLSEQIHAFLEQEKVSERTAYLAALCLEELAADFVAHSEEEHSKGSDQEVMDIKLFSDEGFLRLIIRNAAKGYNPLDFRPDDENVAKIGVKMVQKNARRIEYSYVYKINIVTIDLDK